jgi:hypothetical protein
MTRLDAEVEAATDDCLQLEPSLYRVPVHFHSTIRYQLALCCGGMLPDQHVGLNPPHTRRVERQIYQAFGVNGKATWSCTTKACDTNWRRLLTDHRVAASHRCVHFGHELKLSSPPRAPR